MANTVNLEFAGDAKKLARAAKQAEEAITGVGRSATEASDDMRRSAEATDQMTTRTAKLMDITEGTSTAIGDAAGTLQGLVDIQQYGAEKAAKLGRALNDVKQAQQDLNQAQADGRQATLDVGQAQIDSEQAALDAAQAMKDYKDAVKEHGAGSQEARQAQLDLKQAQQDSKQATEDLEQAQLDANQALVDAEGAQLDMNDAMREANPPQLQEWADKLNLVAPLLTGLVGILGLVSVAQWAWNAAQLASPMTWIILAIVALIAIIVLIATKTDWFQKAWKAAWGWIKDAAGAVGSWFKDTLWGKWIKGAWDAIKNKAIDVWNWMKGLPGKLKGAFSSIKDFLFAPFKAAFNLVSSAWNNTVGRLSWTVPGWVPGIGGYSISAPKLPKFHSGGRVPGAPGTETLAILQAGEKVTSLAGSVGSSEQWIRIDLGGGFGDALLAEIAKAVGRRGGGVTALGVKMTAAGAVRP